MTECLNNRRAALCQAERQPTPNAWIDWIVLGNDLDSRPVNLEDTRDVEPGHAICTQPSSPLRWHLPCDKSNPPGSALCATKLLDQVLRRIESLRFEEGDFEDDAVVVVEGIHAAMANRELVDVELRDPRRSECQASERHLQDCSRRPYLAIRPQFLLVE